MTAVEILMFGDEAAPAAPRPSAKRAKKPLSPVSAETRRAAYQAAKEAGPHVFAKIIGFARAHPEGYTPDEIADAIRVHFLTVRPACTKLKSKGVLREQGTKRPTASGKSAAVLVLAE